MAGHLSAPTKWTEGPTTIEFMLNGSELAVLQDGKRLASTQLTGSLAQDLGKIKSFKNIKWGKGIYGPFGGTSMKGKINIQ